MSGSGHGHHEQQHETGGMHDQPDAWHQHQGELEKPQTEHLANVKAGPVIAIGIFLFLLIMGTTALVVGYYKWDTVNRLDRALHVPGKEEETFEARAQLKALMNNGGTFDVEVPNVDEAGNVKGTKTVTLIQLPLKSAEERVLESYAAAQRGR